jgi:hypothetical protein
MNYSAGRELCRSYVAGEPERFRRLLTEQVRVRDLLEARAAGAPMSSGWRASRRVQPLRVPGVVCEPGDLDAVVELELLEHP